MPENLLYALRTKLYRCRDYNCHRKVQHRYCDGYWDLIKECKTNMPTEVRSDLREKLNRCAGNPRCRHKVLHRYCEGQWDTIAECGGE